MTPERWASIKAVFQEALGVEPAARAAMLDRACGEDHEMREEVESLLAAYDGAGSFMDATPATRVMRCSRCDSLFTAAHVVCPSDGEVLVEDPAALVDVTLDELYHVEAVVGRGGFGTVYRARHALLDDRVAVKVLRREFSANPSLVRRFLREGRVARAIRHPNVVAIHDMRTSADGLVYMVLEYVDGRTLREELAERGPLPRDEAVEILGQIARALDAAHEGGVVHRDLKPENVMLAPAADESGRVIKVLDLGLAKLCEIASAPEQLTELTLPGQQMGSPQYMSPEQWGDLPADSSREVDARSDVYALGVMAYEMLVGRRPFAGETFWDVRRAHLEAPRPLEAGPAVARAMARDRADRFASAGAFVEALARVEDARPRRRRARVAVGLGLAAALAGLAAVGVWWSRVEPERPAAQAPATAPAARKTYAEMTDTERVAFVDEQARAVSRMLAGREYRFPPDARVAVKRQVDLYTARVGTGETRFGKEDLSFVFDRGRRYAPAIAPPFARAGVPLVIALYLPMIESEYRSDEVSSAGSRGMFQIMPQTGARYGAKPEDLDSVERSADVAARHFRDCMDEFARDRMGNALALAAYNMGAKDIHAYLDDVQALDDDEAELRFWSLASNSGFKNFENRESPRYITSFFAAAIVGENPEAFGLAMRPLSSYASGE
jgi:serine/threonine-protein kinase